MVLIFQRYHNYRDGLTFFLFLYIYVYNFSHFQVLLTSPDAVLASLTPALVTEANMLRERFAHRYHSNGTPFGMYPRNRRGPHSRRNDLIGSSLERSGASSHRHLGIKMVEADGSPLVDMDALKAMIRLFRVVQVIKKNFINSFFNGILI